MNEFMGRRANREDGCTGVARWLSCAGSDSVKRSPCWSSPASLRVAKVGDGA